MSLLTVVQGAMSTCGQRSPSQALSATDPLTQQFVSLAQDVGDELSELYWWRQLNIPFTITGDGTSTLWPIPTDWAQLSPGEQMFSSLYPGIPIVGPVTNEELAAMKSSPAFPTRPVYRLLGGMIELWPALGNGEVLTGNYYSLCWIADSAGLTRKYTWSSDSDFSMISERTLRLGVVWRWKHSKGLDYAEDFRRYTASLDRAAGRDGTGRVVAMSKKPFNIDGWFPGSITDNSTH